MSLASCICWTDDFSSFLHLLSIYAMPSISVTVHGSLGTTGNLELRKRRGVARLAFNNVGLAGLMGDVDAGHARDAARNDVVCIGHL